MTKYVLIGGYASKAADGGRAFAEELVEGFGEPVKFLDVMFARPEEEWAKSLETDKTFFATHLPHTKIEFKVADKKHFVEQAEWADVVNLRGGTTLLLRESLNEHPGWEKKLDGKTLAGSSAGANLMAKYYHGLNRLDVREGFGLVPVKVIVHWKSETVPPPPGIDWDTAYELLKNHGENLPILTLAEGEFKVIEQ